MSAREDLRRLSWWHTIDIGGGELTPGGWDLRPTARRLPWPPRLDGLRCLDIGTMDGFWAFEMERRGAAEVVAIDLTDPGRQDAPYRDHAGGPGPARGETFRTAAALLGSRVELRDMSVYDLDPAVVGEFDLVVMGYVLQMLRDPLRGLAAIRSACRGHLIVLDTISLPLSAIPAPVARLCARRGYLEWFVFNRRGLVRALELTGFEVEEVTPVLRDHAGPGVGRIGPVTRAKHAAGLLGRSAAVRARARD